MHSDLIAKLEALDGPSREVDRDIATHFGDPWDYGVSWRGWGIGQDGRPIEKPVAFPYTASLDAAIALVGRVLPGWSWEARRSGFGNGQASVWNPMEQPRPGKTIRADHKSSPAIALLIATLKALEARDG